MAGQWELMCVCALGARVECARVTCHVSTVSVVGGRSRTLSRERGVRVALVVGVGGAQWPHRPQARVFTTTGVGLVWEGIVVITSPLTYKCPNVVLKGHIA